MGTPVQDAKHITDYKIMKKTLIALMALASVAAADTYTSSTPGKSGSGAQGGYWGFTLAPANTTYLTTDIPAGVTELNLDSLTILTRTGNVSTNDMKVAVYAYEGDSMVGTYLGSSSSTGTEIAADTTLTLTFSGVTIDPTARYQFLFVQAEATDLTLSTFDGYKSVATSWGIAVTNSFSSNIPQGWGTYKGNGINSWEGQYVPVTTLTMSTVGSTESPVVPEPATATLSLLALAGLAARRRRK